MGPLGEDQKRQTKQLLTDNIPLSARIMAVADTYDALRSRRPYKPNFTHEKSCAIIMEGISQHFDFAVIAAFRAAECEFAESRERMDDGTI